MSHIDEGILHAYLDGALPPGDGLHAALTAHLELCGDCRVRLDAAADVKRQADELLGALRPTIATAPDFDDVLRRADGAPQEAGATPMAGRPARRRFMMLAWAASLAVAVGAGWIARATMGGAGGVRSLPPQAEAARDAGSTDARIASETDPVTTLATAEPAPNAAPAVAPTAGRREAASGPGEDAPAHAERGGAAAAAPGRAAEPVAAAPEERAAEATSALAADRLALAELVVTGSVRPATREGEGTLPAPDSNASLAGRVAATPAVPAPAAVQRSMESLVLAQSAAADAPFPAPRSPLIPEFQRPGRNPAAGASPRDSAAAVPPPLEPTLVPAAPAVAGVPAPASPGSREPSPGSQRPASPERFAPAEPRGGNLLSRLFGGGERVEAPRARWRASSIRDVERRQRHELAHVPGLAIEGVWLAEEAGVITYRFEQRTSGNVVVQLLQWHDPVTSKLRRERDTAAWVAVVRTTERADGISVVFADLGDGTHVSLTAAMPLSQLLELAHALRPLDERN